MDLAARIGTMAANADVQWIFGAAFGAGTTPCYPCILNHWILVEGGHSVTWNNAVSIDYGGLMIMLDANKKYINYINGRGHRTFTLNSNCAYLGISSYYDDERYKDFSLYDNTAQEWLFKDGQIAPGHDGGDITANA